MNKLKVPVSRTAPGRKDPRARFLAAARSILVEGGPRRLTFDAVAANLGVSKQAVIHWFPTKSHLIAALVLPELRAEAQTVIDACALGTPLEARRKALTVLAEFHFADLDRFRMIYLAPQTGPGVSLSATPEAVREIHRITGDMYVALAGTVTDREPEAARLEAVVMHAAVVGVVTMVALGESIGDPMKHKGLDQVAALVRRYC